MDKPLFGNQKNESQLSLIFSIIVGVVVLEAIGVLVVFGIIKSFVPHFFYAGLLLLVGISLFVLVGWYKEGDLDPKFKFLIGALILTLLAGAGFANVTAIMTNPSSECEGYYSYTTGECIIITNLEMCTIYYDFCIKTLVNDTANHKITGTCMNCTYVPPNQRLSLGGQIDL
eukprot:TRINITY_DN7546_c0_g1_i1.p1 TRINITY_DN7546_c0_g1~~TRINITY_DN7546_c0_g1_i1.p1  ORF type:complete len:172 (+),score=31.75 TRINITY_DN7546_c0_g1_i1:100-615(+)